MSGKIDKLAPPHAGSTAYINARIVDPIGDAEYLGAVLISDGKIAILVECPHADEKKITDALNKMGAESVKPAEAQHL